MRVLVVEDDKELSRALVHILQHVGYEVDAVFNGEDGITYAQAGDYDVIIFDVMLPKKDGFSATEELRKTGIVTPILLLTAKGAIPDKIEGLDSGADSYMTKPFSPQELLARLRALTRRHVSMESSLLQTGDLELNLSDRQLLCGKEAVQLSNKEFLIMELLMEHPGQLLARQQIADKAWDADVEVSDNNIEAYIAMLRKKLRFLESSMMINTERNVGYIFSEEQR